MGSTCPRIFFARPIARREMSYASPPAFSPKKQNPGLWQNARINNSQS